MTNVEIEKANELMKRKTEARESEVYMSAHWLYFEGQALGIESIMANIGYEWDGVEFVEAGT